ncbi:UDP-glucose 4-epimerase family protein [Enterovibrio norvegicus]|uniref:UDP-glucose 4-epimerase family protein n=1 Tax=Enterovibrio norvegicus TaxID=188144 RepID=UPI003D161FD1
MRLAVRVSEIVNLFVTGGTGFVGRQVVDAATLVGWLSVFQSRLKNERANSFVMPKIDSESDWSSVLNDVDVVVHCAARVHQMNESLTPEETLATYLETNTLGTLNLAKQAADAGVKRFIFISSIKVNGEYTLENEAFNISAQPSPCDSYGVSKYEAEVGLREIAEKTGMDVVIIRPPLVYGPGVKANFLAMMNLVQKRIPLPFGAIRNRRSLVYIENLVSLVILCCEHPNAANKTFLVSDNDDVSTTRMLNEIAKGMGRKSLLIPVPQKAIEFAAKLLGKSHIADRVCGNLQLDISDTMNTLAWKPPFSFEQGIQRTVSAYLASK